MPNFEQLCLSKGVMIVANGQYKVELRLLPILNYFSAAKSKPLLAITPEIWGSGWGFAQCDETVWIWQWVTQLGHGCLRSAYCGLQTAISVGGSSTVTISDLEQQVAVPKKWYR